MAIKTFLVQHNNSWASQLLSYWPDADVYQGRDASIQQDVYQITWSVPHSDFVKCNLDVTFNEEANLTS